MAQIFNTKPKFMQTIANEHNRLFTNHKVTDIYANDMTSGYEFDGINDSEHKVEQLDLQDYFYDSEDTDSVNEQRWTEATLEDKAYALNELITAQNEGL